MSGIVGSAGSKSKLFNFFGYIQVPFATTTIGNTLFTVSIIPFITAIISYIFLKEKIKKENIIIMLFALIN